MVNCKEYERPREDTDNRGFLAWREASVNDQAHGEMKKKKKKPRRALANVLERGWEREDRKMDSRAGKGWHLQGKAEKQKDGNMQKEVWKDKHLLLDNVFVSLSVIFACARNSSLCPCSFFQDMSRPQCGNTWSDHIDGCNNNSAQHDGARVADGLDSEGAGDGAGQ